MDISEELCNLRKEIERKKKKLEEIKQRHNNRPNRFYCLKDNNELFAGGDVEKPATVDLEHVMKMLDIPSEDTVPIVDEEQLIANVQQNILKKSLQSLSIISYPMVDIPQQEVIYYTKDTQTTNEINDDQILNTPLLVEPECTKNEHDSHHAERYRSTNMSLQSDDNFFDYNIDNDDEEESSDVYELDEEKLDNIKGSKLFVEFFDNACTMIERSQGTQTDICFDYGKELISNKGNKLYDLDPYRSLYSVSKSKNKTIACLEWSTFHSELILASYIERNVDFGYTSSLNNSSNQNPDGCVFVWNTRFPSDQNKPEYIFHFQSPITSACFSPFHPNLVVGGTYSGRILLWDNRTGKMMPVQRSNVSTICHAYPVFCTQIVGTQNAHNLISISSDGRLCTWSLDMLSQPTETIDLAHKSARTISATSMSFKANNINHCVVGSEEGNLYNVQRLGNRTGIIDIYDAHFGPITSVHCHPEDYLTPEFSNLFLSSSMDWTIKLWDSKINYPLLTFEDYSDYICDVRWSPTKTSIFACVDSLGKLDIWDINKSFESPIASIDTPNETSLTKVRWSPNGNYIATGSECGRIEIYNTNHLNQEISNESKQFHSVVDKLKEKSTSIIMSATNNTKNRRLPTHYIDTT